MPFKRKVWNLGFLGDMLIGGCAALVGYTFFNSFGNGYVPSKDADIVKLVGFCIATGYAGARILNAALEKFPDKRLTKLELQQEAVRLHDAGKYDLAARKFRQALELNPEDLQTKANLALSLSYLGDAGAQEALKLLAEVVETKPTDSEAWYNIACIRAISTKPVFSDDAVLDPLRKAFEISSSWKQYCWTDEDLDRFRIPGGHSAYRALTGDEAVVPLKQ
ncbi:hypothetical protein PEC18_26065 [Paucibacter sp. O1-1]|nr:hypothetical protein [Paucibacter sp. O1-1]MDA3829207.1 hypothetical protein [Paucibacter sp. O1-1]